MFAPYRPASLIATLFVLSLLPAQAANSLKVLLDTSTEMPMAELRGTRLTAGLHHDVGQALAAELGRTAQFIVLPRKRLSSALESGEADLMCHYLPDWLPGKLGWSTPFLPNAELLISDRREPRPAALTALANIPIGTVLGFAYPELDKALGRDFRREDAPSSGANLRKFAAGRVQHAVVNQLFLAYQQRQGHFKAALHPALIIRPYQAQCAVSPKGSVSLAEVNRAIAALQARDAITPLFARYR